MRFVSPVRTLLGGISMVVSTDAGKANVAARNSTGDVNWRESNSRHDAASLWGWPSTFAMSWCSVVPHVTDDSASSSAACALDMSGEWNAPPTFKGVARFQP